MSNFISLVSTILYYSYRINDKSLPFGKALLYNRVNYKRALVQALWFFPRNCTVHTNRMRGFGLQKAFIIWLQDSN